MNLPSESEGKKQKANMSLFYALLCGLPPSRCDTDLPGERGVLPISNFPIKKSLRGVPSCLGLAGSRCFQVDKQDYCYTPGCVKEAIGTNQQRETGTTVSHEQVGGSEQARASGKMVLAFHFLSDFPYSKVRQHLSSAPSQTLQSEVGSEATVFSWI